MIFRSEGIAKAEIRLFVDEVAPRGTLVRSASGGLELEREDGSGVDMQRVERWLSEAGLHITDRRRRGRRWTLRARSQEES